MANVTRNLWSQKSSSASSARFATALHVRRKWPFGEQLEFGETRKWLESRRGDDSERRAHHCEPAAE